MRKFFPLLIGILLLAPGVFAQSQATTGNIEGRVVDPQGAAVPNVSVTAKSQDTGAEKTAQSSDEGNFVLPLLPPGNYTVTTVAGQGFGVSSYENVRVTVGAKTTLEVGLSASGSVNVVDVNAEGQGVETTRTSISSTVEERRVINLPTNGRNFLEFRNLNARHRPRPDQKRRFGGRRAKRNFEQLTD
ncbi:MAG TPA: carboxypeptidase-like regulatory domain-containing protein [Pyrinomonadaceae bacterium]|nr:carboxypeptidase-like regulatory domain-containing protein [Pyrinomonadaceae bacterium]